MERYHLKVDLIYLALYSMLYIACIGHLMPEKKTHDPRMTSIDASALLQPFNLAENIPSTRPHRHVQAMLPPTLYYPRSISHSEYPESLSTIRERPHRRNAMRTPDPVLPDHPKQ